MKKYKTFKEFKIKADEVLNIMTKNSAKRKEHHRMRQTEEDRPFSWSELEDEVSNLDSGYHIPKSLKIHQVTEKVLHQHKLHKNKMLVDVVFDFVEVKKILFSSSGISVVFNNYQKNLVTEHLKKDSSTSVDFDDYIITTLRTSTPSDPGLIFTGDQEITQWISNHLELPKMRWLKK